MFSLHHLHRMYLDQDVNVPSDLVHKYSEVGLRHLNTGIKELRRLFLVEDLVDSLKVSGGARATSQPTDKPGFAYTGKRRPLIFPQAQMAF